MQSILESSRNGRCGFSMAFYFFERKNILDMLDFSPMEVGVGYVLEISLTVCPKTIRGIILGLLAGTLPEEGSRGYAV